MTVSVHASTVPPRQATWRRHCASMDARHAAVGVRPVAESEVGLESRLVTASDVAGASGLPVPPEPLAPVMSPSRGVCPPDLHPTTASTPAVNTNNDQWARLRMVSGGKAVTADEQDASVDEGGQGREDAARHGPHRPRDALGQHGGLLGGIDIRHA